MKKRSSAVVLRIAEMQRCVAAVVLTMYVETWFGRGSDDG